MTSNWESIHLPENSFRPLFRKFNGFPGFNCLGMILVIGLSTQTPDFMKTPVETLAKPKRSVESLLHRSIRNLSFKIEEFMVHKTQTERRKALFGVDPLMQLK